MEILGMSPVRLVVNGVGAVGGIIAAEKFINPMLPETLFGRKTSGPGLDLADVVTGISAVLGAALANKVYSNVKG